MTKKRWEKENIPYFSLLRFQENNIRYVVKILFLKHPKEKRERENGPFTLFNSRVILFNLEPGLSLWKASNEKPLGIVNKNPKIWTMRNKWNRPTTKLMIEHQCLTSTILCTFLGLFFGLVGGLQPVMARKSSLISSCESVALNFWGFSVLSVLLVMGLFWDSCFFYDVLVSGVFPAWEFLDPSSPGLLFLLLFPHFLPTVSSSSSPVFLRCFIYFFLFFCFFFFAFQILGVLLGSLFILLLSLGSRFQFPITWRGLLPLLIRFIFVVQLRRVLWFRVSSSSLSFSFIYSASSSSSSVSSFSSDSFSSLVTILQSGFLRFPAGARSSTPCFFFIYFFYSIPKW